MRMAIALDEGKDDSSLVLMLELDGCFCWVGFSQWVFVAQQANDGLLPFPATPSSCAIIWVGLLFNSHLLCRASIPTFPCPRHKTRPQWLNICLLSHTLALYSNMGGVGNSHCHQSS
uniref:Uncharacterized protein n=1 Tax=Eutreptiella gymnastica TaxID=73025 RepID=A0A7S4GJH4_9EUGL